MRWLRPSSFTARGQKPYVPKRHLSMEKSLFHFYKNPVYVGKIPFHLERIYNIVPGSPGIPEFSVCHIVQDFCKGETVFSNIQMPFGVHTVSDREL